MATTDPYDAYLIAAEITGRAIARTARTLDTVRIDETCDEADRLLYPDDEDGTYLAEIVDLTDAITDRLGAEPTAAIEQAYDILADIAFAVYRPQDATLGVDRIAGAECCENVALIGKAAIASEVAIRVLPNPVEAWALRDLLNVVAPWAVPTVTG